MIGPFAERGVFPRRELAYREFHCARLVLTLIYRNIIEKDVLRQILDGASIDRYMTEYQAALR